MQLAAEEQSPHHSLSLTPPSPCVLSCLELAILKQMLLAALHTAKLSVHCWLEASVPPRATKLLFQ